MSETATTEQTADQAPTEVAEQPAAPERAAAGPVPDTTPRPRIPRTSCC